MKKREAIALGLKTYNTGKPCKKGHYCDRNIKGECLICRKLNDRARNGYQGIKEIRQASIVRGTVTYFTGKPCKHGHVCHHHIKRGCLKCYEKNLHTKRELNKDPERRAQIRFKNQFYRTVVPKWAELDSILELYREAVRLSDETGILHEVDHIIPLNATNICGLHVLGNLQIITHDENTKKNGWFFSR